MDLGRQPRTSSAHAHKLAIFEKCAAKNDRIPDQGFNTIFTGEAPERGLYMWKVVINMWTTDLEDTICQDYDGVLYEEREQAERAAYQANAHECDNEYLDYIGVEEV